MKDFQNHLILSIMISWSQTSVVSIMITDLFLEDFFEKSLFIHHSIFLWDDGISR